MRQAAAAAVGVHALAVRLGLIERSVPAHDLRASSAARHHPPAAALRHCLATASGQRRELRGCAHRWRGLRSGCARNVARLCIGALTSSSTTTSCSVSALNAANLRTSRSIHSPIRWLYLMAPPQRRLQRKRPPNRQLAQSRANRPSRTPESDCAQMPTRTRTRRTRARGQIRRSQSSRRGPQVRLGTSPPQPAPQRPCTPQPRTPTMTMTMVDCQHRGIRR